MSQPQKFSDETPTWEAGRRAFAAFVERLERNTRTVALHDSDADGVTAGVVWQRAFERLGFAEALRVSPDRARNAWSVENKKRVRAALPASLFVLDLGSQPEALIENVPTCLIDHHRPEGVPPDSTLITAYNWNPIPNTSLMVWDLCQTLTDVSDLDWIAAIGIVSDLGERDPFEMLKEAKRKHTAKYLKEATTLINAARRASAYDPEAAARARSSTLIQRKSNNSAPHASKSKPRWTKRKKLRPSSPAKSHSSVSTHPARFTRSSRKSGAHASRNTSSSPPTKATSKAASTSPYAHPQTPTS
jgi:hypothetical protein